MSGQAHLSWSTLVDLLTSDKKRSIKTLDTVFVSPVDHTLQWYFTSKSGSVSKKKKDSTSVENIIDRFSRFALSNPFNAEGIVGVLVDIPAGLRKWMKTDELSTYLHENIADLNKAGTFLQVYLRPLRGADVVFTCESTRGEAGYNHEIIVVHQHHNSARDTSAKHEVTDSIQSQITDISETILNCLQETHQIEVDQITIEFIVDDNQHAWLSCISHCETAGDESETPDSLLIKAYAGGESISEKPMSIAHVSVGEARVIRNDTGGPAPPKQADAAGAYVGSKLEDKKKSPGRNKKKKDLKTGDSGFRRSLLDEPPNVDLMAKFAAEKER